MKTLKRIGWFLFYAIWQAPQSLCGAVLWLILWPYLTRCHCGYKYYYNPFVNISLGGFVFVALDDAEVVKHELGHQRQSWILGPLYLLVIGLPSILWCWLFSSYIDPFYSWQVNNNIQYDWFYTEAWANWLARKL